MGEAVISLLAFSFGAVLFVVLGVWQLRGEAPAGFYTGEKPPKPEELTDVAAWNRGHGRMWIAYGAALFLVGLTRFVLDGFYVMVLAVVVVLGGLVCLLAGHRRLKKRYLISKI